ncbi:hypothetical protein PaG_03410 [Moesziomyces aphidis]|uniref:Uncharacterized protein n=1 Tax=Moesziomyces aphidis TaxID=84754 RepID=W3VLB4_MOEAP|nr:hypothetical protein PaG_03410 [Moesziomyces aphidis]
MGDSSSTPPARSRRISMLPIRDTEPAQAHHRLQVLELENVGLTEELEHVERKNLELERQLDALRATVAQQPQSGLAESHEESVLASTSMSFDASPNYAAEVKGARRLIHRLATHISAHDPSASLPESAPFDDERYFTLDQSLVHDPERSFVTPAVTHLTTPNGKHTVARAFHNDLLDDVETLRSVWEEHTRRATFAAVEAHTHAERQRAMIEQLRTELHNAQAAAASTSTHQLTQQLQAEQQRSAELEAKLTAAEATHDQLAQLTQQLHSEQQRNAELDTELAAARAKIESLSATDMANEATSERIDELEEQLEAERTRSGDLDAQLSSAEARILQLTAEHELTLSAASHKSAAHIGALEQELAERRTRADEVGSILRELADKRQRLHAIQLHTAQVSALQRVLDKQTRIVALLERDETTSADMLAQWSEYARDMSASLALLRPANSNESLTETTPAQGGAREEDAVAGLREKVDELEARVLRRNEQIGHLQRQLSTAENDLKRTRTNQTLAETTVEELEDSLAELEGQRTELQNRVEQLELHVASLPAATAPTEHADAEAQVALDTAQTQRVQELSAALDTARARLEEHIASLPTVTAPELADASAQATLWTTQDGRIAELELALQAAHTRTAELEAQSDELLSLRTALRKATESRASLALELDAVQLALAEQRESASADAERLEQLEAQLATHDADRIQLATLSERIALLEEELSASHAARDSALDLHHTTASELAALVAKHTELEAVLAARDAAMHARNAEYWTLKEELAELQEEAERSRPEIITPAALSTLRSELDTALQRVAAQEEVLLRFKSDLAAARSTEELLNAQYAAAQRRAAELEGAADARPDAELQERLDKAEEETSYLRTRIDELEQELGRKADEIEEADSKILDALKETKKYATRYTKLSARLDDAKQQLVAAHAQTKHAEEELARWKTRADESAVTRASAAVTPSASKPVGVKRKVDEAEAVAVEEVRAVYAPSPSARPTSFTPVRRTKNAVLGLGTPSTAPDGMVRSSSNPSELVAARLSPTKPALGDRTNLAPAAARTSRLAKTTLVPAHPDPVAKAAPAGAADFLARMKAQSRTR